ncbi:hypothetical protein D0469_10910 [Peribacillus saganii]|uniref:SWIM-type domain-containing protein n=1 Tax=Peribacillus saganii TaxID=2303992 RepID=A0A372LPB1_9BACI|nr:SWIM zinc finger family protein [Peribacillus saganii]RFU68985.1 hypothetical protein D0469_10910 [Peribacillus saganii]
MDLFNFEQSFKDTILKRGKDYYKNGHILSLEETEKGHYTASVDGSEIYSVEVYLDYNEEIIDTWCVCPYEGDFCKHQAAVFLALRERRKKPKDSKVPYTKTDLKTILLKQSSEDLVNLVVKLMQEYPEIESKLMLKYVQTDDEITAAKKLIKESIRPYKRRGFIEWRDVSLALQGAHQTLQTASNRMEEGKIESTVNLSVAVLSIVVEMIQYCDDSDGNLGEVIYGSIDLIDNAVLRGIYSLKEDEQKRVFDSIFKEALHKRYDGWEEWSDALLKVCTRFAGIPELRNKVMKHLEKMLKKFDGSSWSGDHNISNIKLLQLDIIESCEGSEKAEQFIWQNIHHSEFREKAIHIALEREDFQEAERLCIDGEKSDSQYRGLVKQWREILYEIYGKMGHVEKQRELAMGLLLGQDYEYYVKLKQLYQPQQWERVLKNILEAFEVRHTSSVYEKILIEEKQTAKLLEYCRRHIMSITEHYPYLTKEYPQEVSEIFINLIELSSEAASDRKKYKAVCRIIKIYKKACGSENAKALIGRLTQQYIRRPAFLDELGKVK